MRSAMFLNILHLSDKAMDEDWQTDSFQTAMYRRYQPVKAVLVFAQYNARNLSDPALKEMRNTFL